MVVVVIFVSSGYPFNHFLGAPQRITRVSTTLFDHFIFSFDFVAFIVPINLISFENKSLSPLAWNKLTNFEENSD